MERKLMTLFSFALMGLMLLMLYILLSHVLGGISHLFA